MQPWNVNWMERDDRKAPFHFYTPASSHMTRLSLLIRARCILFHRMTEGECLCVCEECAALQSTRVCTEKMWTGDEWMASGLGRTSQSLQLVSPHSCSTSLLSNVCAVILFLPTSLRHNSQRWQSFPWVPLSHLLMCQLNAAADQARAANPARKSDNMLGKRHRRLKCISVSEMLNIHAPAQIPHMCVTLSCF